MKQSWIVIVIAMLMLSACGNKSEVESVAGQAQPLSAEGNKMVGAEPPAPAPAQVAPPEEKIPAPAPANTPPAVAAAKAPAPAAVEPTQPAAQASDGAKHEAMSQEEGLALARKSGCLACHSIETKVMGPAWRAVSERYKGDPGAKSRLVEKVKAGGKGNWTQVTGGIAMPPNFPRVSEENIEKLVSFVLSL